MKTPSVMSEVIEFDKEQEGQRHGGRGERECVCVCIHTQTHGDTQNKEDYKSIFHILNPFSQSFTFFFFILCCYMFIYCGKSLDFYCISASVDTADVLYVRKSTVWRGVRC